jgi:tRNA pseudouridine55 synthase
VSQPYLMGFLNIDKPKGLTSHDVVAQIRRLANTKRVGHGGTLDPMAEGVLPIALGPACRLLRFLPAKKVYLAVFELGISTTTDDMEGTITSRSTEIPDDDTVFAAASAMVGSFLQIPPVYSAVRVGGKHLYQLARKGSDIPPVAGRPVSVEAVQVVSFASPHLTVKVTCSPGTYIRALARDLGAQLGCGACLSQLVRYQSGPFCLEDSRGLAELSAATDLSSLLIPPQAVLDLPVLAVSPSDSVKLRAGQELSQDLPGDRSLLAPRSGDKTSWLLAVSDNVPVAVCRYTESQLSVCLQPEVVLADGPSS